MSMRFRSFARRAPRPTRAAAYLALCLAALIAPVGWSSDGGGSLGGRAAVAAAPLARSKVEIATAAGGRFTFKVEVAVTQAEQARGLMFRQRLADDAGMLFPNAAPRVTAFWMRNTLIPLDIIFIDADGRIAHIHPMATPGSEDTISSGGPVVAVLEINGGFAARLGIRVGDRVASPALGGG